MGAGAPAMPRVDLTAASKPFLDWLAAWVENLPAFDLKAFLAEKGVDPQDVVVVSMDLIEGFCYHGRLASPRIANVVEPSAALFKRAHSLGVSHFVLVQEWHTHDAQEFHQFGPHCIQGTEESKTVEALASLPFADTFTLIHKNTIHPALGTHFDEWLAQRPNANTYIVVGDCTDLCVYQAAMYLKLKANAEDKTVNILVPANCVQTYDLPTDVAQSIGALPHDAELLHALFLYHMALNGAEVVKSIE